MLTGAMERPQDRPREYKTMEFLNTFADDMSSAPSIVWWVAFMLGVITAWILHAYNDNLLFTCVISFAMYLSVMIGNVEFNRIGIMFSPNSDANIVAGASASMCAVMVMAMILTHVFYAFGNLMQRRRYGLEQPSEPNQL